MEIEFRNPRSVPRLGALLCLLGGAAPGMQTQHPPSQGAVLAAQDDPALSELAAEQLQALGYWRTEQGRCLRIEARRVSQFRDGQQSFHMARFVDERIDLLTWGQVSSMWFEASGDGDTLEVCDTEFGEAQLFTRCPELPTELRVATLTFGSHQPDEATNQVLRAELARRLLEDQAVRTQADLDAERMFAIDSDNTAWLIEQLERYGWLDSTRFGAEGSRAAFLIVQHSGDLALMSAALPAIHFDFLAGHVDGQNYSLLYDRLEVNLGRPQLYGSQLGGASEQGMVLMPLADPEHVEALRKEMGLMPLSDYLGIFDKGPGQPPIRRLGLDDWSPVP